MKSIKEYLPPRRCVDEMTPFSVRVPRKLLKQAQMLADREGLTFTVVIESLLTYFVDEMNSKKSA